ncbi:hypothetical protein CYMTET_31439 [Cymbomonas tetramitiformis]|uniref:DUF1995 domain-containing protein n=1 Tax=Cymbomonas tetramitiformis TaxID=36881 RepID=A0AAE0FGT5_9CHLO|nr:hypothetical protein CYMTET_31439 [Cymbomonas tetramitiformis]
MQSQCVRLNASCVEAASYVPRRKELHIHKGISASPQRLFARQLRLSSDLANKNLALRLPPRLAGVRGRLRVATCMASEGDAFPLPQSASNCVQQASDAVAKAMEAGKTRQQVNLLLPTEQRRKNFMFTESMEYPESSSEIYATACQVGKALMQAVLNDSDLEVFARRIDNDGLEGEPVGLLTTASGAMTVVVLPTADVLKEIREVEKNSKGLVVLMNPQWRTKGNVRRPLCPQPAAAPATIRHYTCRLRGVSWHDVSTSPALVTLC